MLVYHGKCPWADPVGPYSLIHAITWDSVVYRVREGRGHFDFQRLLRLNISTIRITLALRGVRGLGRTQLLVQLHQKAIYQGYATFLMGTTPRQQPFLPMKGD